MSAAVITRRALLGATAAVGVTALPAAASALASPASDLDADLFALLDRWNETRVAWDAAGDPFDAAMSRAHAAYPPRPEALWWTTRDLGRKLGATATGREPRPNNRMRMFFGFDDIERLRDAPIVTRWANVGDDHPGPPPREVDPGGEARRQEIIAAHDDWMRARKAVEDAVGYTTAHETVETIAQAINEAEEAVKLCEPRTIPGLVRKAAWVADLLSRDAADENLGEVFARQVAAFSGVAS